MTFVCQPARSAAPHIPRVILIGPRGSGKTTQAIQLADKYNLVDGKHAVVCFTRYDAQTLLASSEIRCTCNEGTNL